MKKYIETENCKVTYDLHNSEKKVCVILIHGFGITRDMWKPQIPVLCDYKVINMDVRGHGESQPCDNFTIKKAANDIKAVMEAENIKTAVLIGLSMGGYAVQEFAHLYPELAEKIMVIGATPLFAKYAKWESSSLKYSGPLLNLYPWNYLKRLMANKTSVNDEVRKELYRMFSIYTKEQFIASWAGIATCLHEEDEKFDFPLCFVYGDKDKSGTVSMHAKDWKVLYPHCEVNKIENASHLANMDNPNKFNSIMLEFIK